MQRHIVVFKQEYDPARMLHMDCKNPQLPDDQLKKYTLKLKEQAPPIGSIDVINAKEERKRRKQAVVVVALQPSDPKKKRAKRLENTDGVLATELKEKELKVKVT